MSYQLEDFVRLDDGSVLVRVERMMRVSAISYLTMPDSSLEEIRKEAIKKCIEHPEYSFLLQEADVIQYQVTPADEEDMEYANQDQNNLAGWPFQLFDADVD